MSEIPDTSEREPEIVTLAGGTTVELYEDPTGLWVAIASHVPGMIAQGATSDQAISRLEVTLRYAAAS